MSLKIGLTGGIGSGKSLVCEIFGILGVPVYQSDQEAKSIINTDRDVREQMIREFGEDIYLATGINAAKLSGIIFKDKSALEKVNSIVHPVVRKSYSEWCQINKHFPYHVKEAAILFESGTYRDVDRVITVFAPLEVRLKRVMDRDGSNESLVRARMNNQLPEEKKVKLSQHVIYNDNVQPVLSQVLELHELFLSFKQHFNHIYNNI